MKKLITSLIGGLAEVTVHPLNVESDESEDNQCQTSQTTTTVQFIHQSVTEFMGKDRFQCFGLNTNQDLIENYHHLLARSCLNYLKLKETRNRCKQLLIRFGHFTTLFL